MSRARPPLFGAADVVECSGDSMAKTKDEDVDGGAAGVAETTQQILGRFGRKRGNLIPILQAAQLELGYLPLGAMRRIADHLKIPPVAVYEVVTFYSQFRLNPPGRHSVRVCLGTACHMKGGYIALDAWKRRLDIDRGQTTADREYDLDTVARLGCCTLAPVTVIDGQPEGRVDPTRVDGILLGFEMSRKEEGKAAS